MQMGIERVLRENFGNDVAVTQVTDTNNGDGGAPTELTLAAVQQEVQRLSTAVIAMGGVVRIVNVDAATGVVQLNFRGANKVQKGLELALLDVPFVNAVQFVNMGDEF
jgi:Fe-S cluster biogenesis protein NfuA